VYQTPAGGVHLVTRVRGEDDERHIELPPHLVKLAEMMADGQKLSPAQLLKVLRRK
jgi:hypothetical protein